MKKKQLFTSLPVTCHTDYVTQGSTFVVIKGLKEDGSAYIQKALEQGASKIVVERGTQLAPEPLALIELLLLIDEYQAELVYVENARKALAHLSAQAAEYPAQKLKFFSVGGTKGKTTTVSMLAHLLKTAGKKVAFLSTALIGIYTDKDELADVDCTGTLTTPQPDYLHQFLKLCVEKGVEYVVLEVAAQAHTFYRLEGIEFEGVIFTNLDREHGELYPSMEQYFLEKEKLFSHLKPGGALLANGDDLYGRRILETHPNACSFGLQPDVRYHATLISDTLHEQQATLTTPAGTMTCTYQGFPGNYNLSNVIAALGLLHTCGFSLEMLTSKTIAFPPVPGRLEMHHLANGALAVIDYAHTAASFEQVLGLMRPRTHQLIVLFGAGGQKDKEKRPTMGHVASRLADVVIVTDDNPRTEDPIAIADHIVSGVHAEHKDRVFVIHDREAAIKRAYELSHPGSIIMLLGKGPDDVQIVGTQRLFFSERQVLNDVQRISYL